MRVVRSLFAVAAGFGFFALVTGLATPRAIRAFGVSEPPAFQMEFFLANLAYTVVAALAAGYLAGRTARGREVAHGAAVGMIMIMGAFFAMRQHGATQPGPYELTTAGCGPVSAMVGAGMAMIQRLRAARALLVHK